MTRPRTRLGLPSAEATRLRLLAITESSEDAVISKTLKGIVTSWNPAAERLYGYATGEMVGQSIARLVPPELADELPAILARLRRGQKITHYETVRLHRNGTRIDVSLTISPIIDDAGKVIGAATIARDITERKKAEATQLRLAAIVESSEDAIITKTLDGTITSWNPAAERLYGYLAEEMVGQPIARLVPPEYPDELPAILVRVRHGERISHYETTRVRKDATRVHVSLSISPLVHPNGDVIGASTIARDITARKQAEDRIRDLQDRAMDQERTARAAAEEAVRMRDSFVAIASHELRTPLTVMKSNVQLLLTRFDRGLADSARVIDGLRTLNRMTDHLCMLVADMLDVSRLRSGQVRLRPERLDMNDVVREVVEAQPGERPVSVQLLGASLPVSADPSRIRQVLSNLIENAIKYSPAGGDIDISLREQDRGICVTVSDHGIGLPPGAAASIFEPFVRASNAQESHLHGMGLGLYITRQIVEQHGGRIWADSAGVGLGAQLHIWLPGIVSPTTRVRPSRVLVVDDEESTRDLLGSLFELEGYDCRMASNGREALHVLSEWGPDLIVLDLMMPIMDGWVFRREQQAASVGREIPVIVMSAGQKHDTRDLELAPHAFLTKPFEMDELVTTIKHILMRESPPPINGSMTAAVAFDHTTSAA